MCNGNTVILSEVRIFIMIKLSRKTTESRYVAEITKYLC